MPRYLTKSKFLLGMECPTKLFYAGKAGYANRSVEDPFLRSLADGGFQVGALAKCYFPEGIQVDTLNDTVAVDVTREYLLRENVTLFEPAFQCGNYFLRADIVVKTADVIEIFEVKAKSADFDDQSAMLKKDGMPMSDWKKYIDDVAFQKLVVRMACPGMTVRARLMLIDKRVTCPTDGLNQKFKVARVEGRRQAVTSKDVSPADLATPLLVKIDVDAACDTVLSSVLGDRRYDAYIEFLAEKYAADEKILSAPTKACGDCQFTTKPAAPVDGNKSGFHDCWRESLGWQDDEFLEPTVLDIWYFLKKDKFLKDGKIRFSQLAEADIAPATDGQPGLSRTERQWKQVQMVQTGETRPFIDRENLKRAIDGFRYPLHFIDFETSMPAIPFKQGRRPYEGVLFQFSHHTVDRDGRIAHAGQFLSTGPGVFPNYDCVRELMRQLDSDDGTIFRYHNHENTFLCTVYDQLRNDPGDIPDRDALSAFIKTITTSTREDDLWTGSRTMVDLYKLVERFHYDPGTNGSVSLKYVLPAALNSSEFLKDKYSRPIYGTPEMPSLNFTNQTWVVSENADFRMQNAESAATKSSPPYGGGVPPTSFVGGGVVLSSGVDSIKDPYQLLPMMFTDETAADYAAIMEMDKIKDGGAAMTAYSKLQFEDIPAPARQAMRSALLKYCELDTLAMVMIYEAWRADI